MSSIQTTRKRLKDPIERAGAVIEAYWAHHEEAPDPESMVCDMAQILADLMHYCRHCQVSYSDAATLAGIHVENETLAQQDCQHQEHQAVRKND